MNAVGTKAAETWERAFREERARIFGICYRMTGSAADADDLVQQTFARALQSPPADLDEPLAPWLVRVAMNFARDQLRRRKRQAYVGPWLPSPIETPTQTALEMASGMPSAMSNAQDFEPSAYEPRAFGGSTEGRYDLLESVSYAFLLALEVLTPKQRAVLLLCDVFDYSVREAAAALAMSETNVKTTHHRARKAMAHYDSARSIPTRELSRRTRAALEAFLGGLVAEDVAAVEKLLAEGVRAHNDGGGEFLAARVVVSGASKVARMYMKLSQRAEPIVLAEMQTLNGLPALVMAFASAPHQVAPRFVLRCDLDAEGRIVALHTVLATKKLTHVRFGAS